MKHWDVCIIGAGAAGLMCAIESGRRGRSVLLLDHSAKPAEKIRISGGGRCNFTNLDIQPDRFLSQNPHFAKSALKRYTQYDFIDMVAQHGIPYHEKTLGQLFCDTSAKDIITMLLTEARQAGVEIRMNTGVDTIEKSDRFQLSLPNGSITADALVIATGGKSIPKMGATGWGYHIATQFGLPLIETRPALVPLTFAEQDLEKTKPLSGISVTASVRNTDASFDEGLLFTHRGLSGPSILQISSYWREGQGIGVNLATGQDTFATLKSQRQTAGRGSIAKALSQIVPARLADQIAQDVALKGNLADQSDKALQTLHDRVHDWQIKPVGSEGYRTAEVTLGGVDTNALDAKTMMAKTVPGLFFIGEVVDVTGWLGGYNFQWAWSSGWAAGQAV
ncbi:NAD(P)/FAD-dependent oxidoreductase [Amylibacter sp. IMCC11727]|uniref:NAD(P)/FAD-dependent oxidoreductase n=1 Tax=Amylibacter sp. IMCC11727 TaxID=3039851 RepID=UPI00244E2D39|nr:NAD(P)/FAD-dependent oxidoreductase [Amylibacter sp. IMCC11727]WGI23332.1 NAD(P)/FAD-dependent oxidoreductase [Amylibacter sp. IMCC11727]